MASEADIPEVEAEIAGITRIVHDHWVESAREGVRDAIAELEDRDQGSRERDAALIALLLLLIGRSVERPMRESDRSLIRSSARRLLLAGASRSARVGALAGSGVGGAFVSLETWTAHAGAGLMELEFMSAARLEGTQLADRVEKRLKEYFDETDSGKNGPRSAADGRGGAASTPGPSQTPAGRTKIALDALRDDLDTILGDTNAALSETIVDAWSYRQHNIGAFLAMRAVGVREFVAQNPRDERTTPFCRWVHGKVVKVERVERQLREFRAAARAGDKSALIEAWPFFDHSKKGMEAFRRDVQGDLGGRRPTDAELFKRFFLRVGLPPYHWRCRTVVVPR